MEEPIVGINQRVKDMEISDKFSENDQLLMREELPPRYSDGYTFRDFLRGLGFDPDEVLNPENRTNSYVPTPQIGFTLVPSGGHSSYFQAVGPGKDKELVFPCADQALADFNSKHNTDYKCAEGLGSACLHVGFHLGCYRIHCNFIAMAETKPLMDGDFFPEVFFVDAEYNADGSISLISYSRLVGENKYGCEMCPDDMLHPAS